MQEIGRKIIFPQYWQNFHDILRPEINNLLVFHETKAWKTILTNYGKVLVLNFGEIGNAVFFEPKRYLLIPEKFFFRSFWRWEIFFELKGWWKDDIYWLKVLVSKFFKVKNVVFFEPERWWKYDIYLMFLSFLWYFRTWET